MLVCNSVNRFLGKKKKRLWDMSVQNKGRKWIMLYFSSQRIPGPLLGVWQRMFFIVAGSAMCQGKWRRIDGKKVLKKCLKYKQYITFIFILLKMSEYAYINVYNKTHNIYITHTLAVKKFVVVLVALVNINRRPVNSTVWTWTHKQYMLNGKNKLSLKHIDLKKKNRPY